MAYTGALLTGLYACLDGADWAGLGVLLTADARWHVLPSAGYATRSVDGRDAICRWLAALHSGPVTHEITAVRDEGTCAAVFLAVEHLGAGAIRRTHQLDSYRFSDGLAKYVSLQVG